MKEEKEEEEVNEHEESRGWIWWRLQKKGRWGEEDWCQVQSEQYAKLSAGGEMEVSEGESCEVEGVPLA